MTKKGKKPEEFYVDPNPSKYSKEESEKIKNQAKELVAFLKSSQGPEQYFKKALEDCVLALLLEPNNNNLIYVLKEKLLKLKDVK